MPLDLVKNDAVVNAIQFLEDNPSECTTTAARIFKVNATTIRMRRTRATRTQTRRQQSEIHGGGNNKILSTIQVKAIKKVCSTVI